MHQRGGCFGRGQQESEDYLRLSGNTPGNLHKTKECKLVQGIKGRGMKSKNMIRTDIPWMWSWEVERGGTIFSFLFPQSLLHA